MILRFVQIGVNYLIFGEFMNETSGLLQLASSHLPVQKRSWPKPKRCPKFQKAHLGLEDSLVCVCVFVSTRVPGCGSLCACARECGYPFGVCLHACESVCESVCLCECVSMWTCFVSVCLRQCVYVLRCVPVCASLRWCVLQHYHTQHTQQIHSAHSSHSSQHTPHIAQAHPKTHTICTV